MDPVELESEGHEGSLGGRACGRREKLVVDLVLVWLFWK